MSVLGIMVRENYAITALTIEWKRMELERAQEAISAPTDRWQWRIDDLTKAIQQLKELNQDR